MTAWWKDPTIIKTYGGMILAFIVVSTACALEAYSKHFNEVVLMEVLTFSGAVLGIAYASFRRQTQVVEPQERIAAAPPQTNVDKDSPKKEDPPTGTSE